MGETSFREGAQEMRKQVRPSELNPKLEEAVQNKPLLPHLLSWRVVFGALAIGAVVALVLYLLASPMMAGIGLILAFFGAWFGLATVSYGRASEREPSDSQEEGESEEE